MYIIVMAGLDPAMTEIFINRLKINGEADGRQARPLA